MAKDLTKTDKWLVQTEDSEKVRLVSLISDVWNKGREKDALSVSKELQNQPAQLVRKHTSASS